MPAPRSLVSDPRPGGPRPDGRTGPAAAADPLVFVSAFAPGDQGGIHAYDVRHRRTASSSRSTARPGVENPFFLALSPDQKFLYSIHAKQFGGKENEQVAAYQVVGRTGELKLLNRQSAEGTAACYLDVDETGKAVLVANYSSGSVASLPVKADGSLGEHGVVLPAQGVEREPAAAEGAARPLHRRQPGQQVRLRRRPGHGPDPLLQARPGRGEADAEQAAVREGARRGRAAAPDVPPERQAGLRHQRTAELGHGVRLRRGRRHPDREADDLDAARTTSRARATAPT